MTILEEMMRQLQEENEHLKKCEGQAAIAASKQGDTKKRRSTALLDSFRELAAFFEADDLLDEAHYALLSHLESITPERCCSCHIHPPCSDCVNHSYSRELIKNAEKAIKKDDNELVDESDDIVI